MPDRHHRWLPTILFLAAIVAVAGWAVWTAHRTVHASPENESLFLKTYTPMAVVKPFKLNAGEVGGGAGDGAGTQCARHSREFENRFVMLRSQWPALMSAVAADISRQLQATGARITQQSGDVDRGFSFSYETGQSIGSISAQSEQAESPSPGDREDEALKVSIYETWFAKGDHSSEMEKPELCQ
jgi:hypothetical protein